MSWLHTVIKGRWKLSSLSASIVFYFFLNNNGLIIFMNLYIHLFIYYENVITIGASARIRFFLETCFAVNPLCWMSLTLCLQNDLLLLCFSCCLTGPYCLQHNSWVNLGVFAWQKHDHTHYMQQDWSDTGKPHTGAKCWGSCSFWESNRKTSRQNHNGTATVFNRIIGKNTTFYQCVYWWKLQTKSLKEKAKMRKVQSKDRL